MISIVIPVYNEEHNLPELSSRIADVLAARHMRDYEIIFIDDGSSDQSWSIIEKLAEIDGRVKGILLSRNFGQQRAISAGLDAARGDAVIMMDADLQHPPELIPQFLEKHAQGFDIVYSIRLDDPKQGMFKRISSRFFYWLFRKTSGLELPYGVADFRLIGKDALAGLKSCREYHRFLRGLVYWIGYRSAAIEYRPSQRLSGQTKYSLKKMWRLAFEGTFSFSTLPLHLSTLSGVIIAGFGFLYAVFALWAKFILQQTVSGWTSIIITVLILGGIQLIFLGIIGEYVARIFDQVKNRPVYLVHKTTRTTRQ